MRGCLLVGLVSTFALMACDSPGAVILDGGVEDLGDDSRLVEITDDGGPDIALPEAISELGPEVSDLQVGETTILDWQPGPGEPGYPCSDGTECNEGFCIHTPDGHQCSPTCEEECPFGWECVQYTPSLPDQVFICAPVSMDLCRPCHVNVDCLTNGADTGQKCIPYGAAGSFCGTPCGDGGVPDCGSGYDCLEVVDVSGAPATQCILAKGECACVQWFSAQGAATSCYLENEWGKCPGERECVEAGLTPCTADTPAAETCNGKDDDCDDETDEGLSGGDCLVINPYGTCSGSELCSDGVLECIGEEAEPEQCDGQDNNCNGQADEGFADTDQDGIADCMENDIDGDGIADALDNCPAIFNPKQQDFDFDNFGDLCDADDDNDQVPDDLDCAPLDAEVNPEADEVCDGKDNDCNFMVDEGFPDSDSDGFKDCIDDDDDNDGTTDGLDCQPLDGAVYPGAPELCDGVDNDCNGAVDQGHPDLDKDGLADCVDPDIDGDGLTNDEDNCDEVANPEQQDLDQDTLGDACDEDVDGDSIPNGTDNCPQAKNTLQTDVDEDDLGDACDDDMDGDGVGNDDDNCPMIFNVEQADLDEDGVGDACENDKDGDGTPDQQDCAPEDPAIHPGAPEACDGADNDCSGLADEGYPDFDADGIKNCVDSDDDGDLDPDETDCQPFDPLIHHDALEVCDGVDNNCDGNSDEELGKLACGKGQCFHTVPACLDGEPQQCDPLAGISLEQCDGLDNDCDGLTDEDLGWTQCGVGQCEHTVANCINGEPQECDPLAGTGPEICDGLDNDCDGKDDEELGSVACGEGACFHVMAACVGGVEAECNPFQGALPESCDGVDNDCDGSKDEELGTTSCGVGKCLHEVDYCANGKVQNCNQFAGAEPETCDGQDNDCDGLTDEDLGQVTCGLGACEHTVANCVDGGPQLCDPLEGEQVELCDGQDNDCDGQIDNGIGNVTCGLGICEHTIPICVGGVPQVCDPLAGAVDETCDGLDNNCNGEADDGFPDTDEDGQDDCQDDDDDGDNDPDITDCAPLDDSIAHGLEEICSNDVDDDCDAATPDACDLQSCRAILEAVPGAVSGPYLVDPDGAVGPLPQVQVYCDMEADGGGWTLVYRGTNTAGTNESPIVTTGDAFGQTPITPASVGHHKLADAVINKIRSGEVKNDLKFMIFVQGSLLGASWHPSACVLQSGAKLAPSHTCNKSTTTGPEAADLVSSGHSGSLSRWYNDAALGYIWGGIGTHIGPMAGGTSHGGSQPPTYCTWYDSRVCPVNTAIEIWVY